MFRCASKTIFILPNSQLLLQRSRVWTIQEQFEEPLYYSAIKSSKSHLRLVLRHCTREFLAESFRI